MWHGRVQHRTGQASVHQLQGTSAVGTLLYNYIATVTFVEVGGFIDATDGARQ